MKLNYAYSRISSLFSQSASSEEIITHVTYDTRKIIAGESSLFFALEGSFRNGHDFLESAYEKGVRHFVVSRKGSTSRFKDAHEIVVSNTFEALQQFATFHRSRFSYPVVAITGSYGKTTVKEWLSELISQKMNVVRSPKSYNSRLGVALSLLEMTSDSDVAIIEVGISEPGDMHYLAYMIQPNLGIFTGLGKAHRSNFPLREAHLMEKISLFVEADSFFYPSELSLNLDNAVGVDISAPEPLLDALSSLDTNMRLNALLAIRMAQRLGLSNEEIKERLSRLIPLSMRLETFEGVRNTTIINDAYNLDEDSLRYALDYQLGHAKEQKRILIVGFGDGSHSLPAWVSTLAREFSLDQVILYTPNSTVASEISHASILIKGTRSVGMEKLAGQLKLHKHQTYLQIDLGAIRHNIAQFKSYLKPSTQVLCMVKAASYGSNAKKMGHFLEHLGVNYLGVAYPTEGIELRDSGVKLPILVMNCEEEALANCIEHELEPAIFSMRQLESFIQELILAGKSHYPIHLKLETGMNRLGFTETDLNALIQKVQSQPEVFVKSIYSHLADADSPDGAFTAKQIERFTLLSDRIIASLSSTPIRHLLNSEGIANHADAQFDMVRLGIGMYGSNSNPAVAEQLKPAISWFSAISQIKTLQAGDSVGYSRTFVADKETKIAVIPVGYADGFRRNLSQGKGGVYIGEHYCPTVGNVCMDMIMVNVTGIDVAERDRVEIIGSHQTIDDLAAKMGTIAYEVMTHFSTRLHRVFLEA